jgi:hypothetical protein
LQPIADLIDAFLEGEDVSTKDKLEEIAAAMRARWQASDQTNSMVGGSEVGPIDVGSTTTTPAPEAERENQTTISNQAFAPLAGLDLDTVIRLRWALRDIKAKRTKLTPVSQSDLEALTEMGLIEMRDDALMLTNKGHQALDQ